jgi:hypothetical protein
MTNLLIKVRDILGDNYQTITETQDYISSMIFSLQYSNVDSTSLKVYKNGVLWSLTPVAGAGVAWARTLTVVTITKSAHGLITGDSVTISVTSDAAALPLATYVVTKLTANTFTIAGLNAGGATGTCTYTITANYSYSAGIVTVTGNLTAGDSLRFDYQAYSKYSDTELQGYIRSALYYLTAEKYKTFAIKPPTLIFPTPTEEEECLVAIIACILIKGSIRQYRTPEFTITFGENLSVEQKIKQSVSKFKKAFGYIDYVDLDEQAAEVEDDEE